MSAQSDLIHRPYNANSLREVFSSEEKGLEPLLKTSLEATLATEGSFGRAHLVQALGLELGLQSEVADDLATAIELFHLASLVLDDLPCMDDATARRARPCAHVAFGESTALLSALAFITRAYALTWQGISGAIPAHRDEAAALVGQCLGVAGILNGQALDLGFARSDRSVSMVERVAILKTGSLLRLCILLPGILAGLSRFERIHLERLARAWGLAYQSADDLKDVLWSEQASGKTSRRDGLLSRPNIALVAGVDEAVTRLQEYLETAEQTIGILQSEGSRRWSSLGSFHGELAGKVAPILNRQAVA